MMKLPEVSTLVTIAVLSTKIWEVWNKIPSVSDLVKKMNITVTFLTLRQNYLLILVIIGFQAK